MHVYIRGVCIRTYVCMYLYVCVCVCVCVCVYVCVLCVCAIKNSNSFKYLVTMHAIDHMDNT